MSIALVTDSTCDLPGEILSGLDVTVVPLYVLFGEESFRQEVDLDGDTFFRMQREAKDAGDLPRTSQPTPADFEKVYRDLLSGKTDTIVSIHVSSDMSGTFQSAAAAREEVLKDFDGSGRDADIRIVDSRSVSVGLAALVIEADRLAKEGKGPEELVKALDDFTGRFRVIFYVGSLEYLHKGGRIGTARALLGTLLNLKLILQVKDGLVQPLAKVRKKSKLFRRMVETMEKETSGEVSGNIWVAHGDAQEDRDALLAAMP